jgi:Zn-dependent metalloprotease
MTRTSPRRDALACWLAAAALVGCTDGDRPQPITTAAVRHMEVEHALASADLAPDAIDYVLRVAGDLDLGLSPADDLEVLSTDERDGIRHVRLRQTYRGVAVLASEVIAHADDTTFLGFNGVLTGHLEGFDVDPAVTEDGALAIADADRAAGATIDYRRQAARLAILPRGEHGADLIWQVELFNDSQPAARVGRWIYFVDAKSGAVAGKIDALTTEQASGPGGNARFARSWSGELDVEPKDGEFEMKSDRMITYDCKTTTDIPDDPVRGPLDPISDAPIDDAHGYTEITLNMMREWMGYESIDGNGYVIKSLVHYDKNWDNAHWDGEYVAYGDGSTIYYPNSGSLDVVAHEMNHGFTEFHSNLTYAGESGGLNESFSDVAGTIAEFYEEGDAADWMFGEDTNIAAGAADRYLCDPTMNGTAIGDYGDYHDGIDVHDSSGIPNRAFCLAVGRYKAVGAGTDNINAVFQVGRIWYTANAAYWTSGTTFVEACRGTIDAARAIGFTNETVEALAASWADVGVECDSSNFVCDGDGTCDAAGGETCASCAEDCGSCSEDCSFWDKAKCKIGIGDCSKCDAEPGCGDHICSGDETDENCAQDCGCEALECGQLAPFGCYCDPVCHDYGDCCSDIGHCE